MRAAIVTRYGPPGVVRIEERAKPVPNDGEILVRVHAATVSRSDCGIRSAHPFFLRAFMGFRRPRRAVLGNDFAGVVEEIGANVTRFQPGDRVFGLTGGILGTHAEYVAIPAEGTIAPMPANLGFRETASIPDGAHLALTCLRAANLQRGQRILINGASGSMGSAGVQLARYLGAEVTAVCGTRNLELARSLGASQVIDYERENFTTLDATFDVVFDAVGKSSYRTCRRLLTERGTFIGTDLGFLWHAPFVVLWTSLFGSRKACLPVPRQRQEDIEWFRSLAETGQYRPVIDRSWPLGEIVDAYAYVDRGQKTGNVVLTVTGRP